MASFLNNAMLEATGGGADGADRRGLRGAHPTLPDETTAALLRLLARFLGGDMQRKVEHRAHTCAIYQYAVTGRRVFTRRWRLSRPICEK